MAASNHAACPRTELLQKAAGCPFFIGQVLVHGGSGSIRGLDMSWTIPQMSASEKAAWYGAVVASVAVLWNIVRDIIGWLKRGPRLKISVYQTDHDGPDTFLVEITNTRPPAAMIESVKLRCFARRLFFFRTEIDHEEAFGLSGSNGFPRMLPSKIHAAGKFTSHPI